MLKSANILLSRIIINILWNVSTDADEVSKGASCKNNACTSVRVMLLCYSHTQCYYVVVTILFLSLSQFVSHLYHMLVKVFKHIRLSSPSCVLPFCFSRAKYCDKV